MVLRQYFPVGIVLTCLEGILLYFLGLVAMKRFYKLKLEIHEPDLITLNLNQGNREAKTPKRSHSLQSGVGRD
jgi:hypothetical protein